MHRASDPHRRLTNAAQAAMDRYEVVMGADVPVRVAFTFPDAGRFRASAALEGEDYTISMDQSIVREIDALWQTLWPTPILKDAQGNRDPSLCPPASGQRIMADLSLTWLALHELIHVRLGHVDLMETASIIEFDDDKTADAAVRLDLPKQDAHAALTGLPVSAVRKCLELQADSDATDVFFGFIDTGSWDDVRRRASAVFVAMSLIERHDLGKGVTHPRASTRYFLVFALLFQMWLHPDASLETDRNDTWLRSETAPDPKAFEAYMRGVIVPAVNDAVDVASWAGASSFIADMRGDGALFRDIETVQYADPLTSDLLRTGAAREWLALRNVNARLKDVLGAYKDR